MGTNAAKKLPIGRVLMASNADEKSMSTTNSAKDLNFSMPKDSSVGDPVLIFTHEGLIGRGRIATKPKKSEKYPTFGERPVWWGKIDKNPELLSQTLLDNDVIRQMPEEWIWHKHPRRSFNTPTKEHFDKLEKIFEGALNKKTVKFCTEEAHAKRR
jgi:hypothetical protein